MSEVSSLDHAADTPEPASPAQQDALAALLASDPPQALQQAQAAAWGITTPADQTETGALLLLGRAQQANALLSEARATLLTTTSAAQTLRLPGLEAQARTHLGKVLLDLGELTEAANTLERALALTADTPPPLSVRAAALNHLAVVRHQQGQVSDALTLLHRSLELREREGNVTGQVQCLTNIGSIQMWFGQYREAIQTLTAAYQLYQTCPADLKLETPILHNLAHVHNANGDNALAIDLMRTAHASAVASGDPGMQAMASLNLGMFLLEDGDLEQARESLRWALDLSRSTGHQVIEMHALDSLGTLYLQVNALDAAQDVIQAALQLAVTTGAKQAELEARLQLGKLHLRHGRLAAARQELDQSLQQAREVQSLKEEGAVHEVLSDLHQRAGQVDLALEHSQATLRIERELFNAERDRLTRNLSLQFEVTRARHDVELYKVRTDVEREGREAAERLVQERTTELAQAQQEVVTRLAMAAEYRDDTTGDHTRRVGRAATLIALALGWSRRQAGLLGVAARLHDVGKIGIPDRVLLKAGTLTAVEYAQMQRHTVIGARILSGGQSELLRMAEEIACTHHERWDGAGYPVGLRAEQIPLVGRIVAVADVFDALTQPRPYKAAWTTAQAAEELRRQKGRQFDPAVVDAALPILTQPDGLAVDGEDEQAALTQEDTTQVLTVFEQLLTERTQELEQARQAATLAAQQLAALALTDSLTGLGNRRAFEADVEQMLEQARRNGQPLTVVYLDIDGMKAVNDSGGHAQGDLYLQACAAALRTHFGQLARPYRIGGDEFVVLAAGQPGSDALQGALDRVHQELRQAQFPTASVSLGSAVYPHDAETVSDLVRISDQRMYGVKLARRGI